MLFRFVLFSLIRTFAKENARNASHYPLHIINIMQLLDIISPGGRRPIRPILHRIDTISPQVDQSTTVKDVIDSCPQPNTVDSTITDSTIMDTLRSGLDFLTGMGHDGGSSSAFWGIFLTVIALGLCIYFAYAYRKRQHLPRHY